MLSSSSRASSAVSTGVLPFLTTYLGPRTAWAGFTSRTWPVTSQSKSMRSAARDCLTAGGENSPWSYRLGETRMSVDGASSASLVTIKCDKGRYHTLNEIGRGMPMSPRVLVRFPDDMRPDRRVRLRPPPGGERAFVSGDYGSQSL